MNKEQLTQNIINRLLELEYTITFAESCTGGRIASAFTAISGASSVVNGSCITYSNEIKHQWLGVSHDTLQAHGAVSGECVSEMLDGIRTMANADVAIAVSGIAGPTGGTPTKPVGTVYIGVMTPDEKIVERFLFTGDRDTVQELATIEALKMVQKQLNWEILLPEFAVGNLVQKNSNKNLEEIIDDLVSEYDVSHEAAAWQYKKIAKALDLPYNENVEKYIHSNK